MEPVLAVVVGVIFAASIYLVLRRSLVKLVLGLALMGHAANLLIFSAGGLTLGRPPFAPDEGAQLAESFADPLPQALVLTAIVISFALTAFALALVYRTYTQVGSEDLDDMKGTDLPPAELPPVEQIGAEGRTSD